MFHMVGRRSHVSLGSRLSYSTVVLIVLKQPEQRKYYYCMMKRNCAPSQRPPIFVFLRPASFAANFVFGPPRDASLFSVRWGGLKNNGPPFCVADPPQTCGDGWDRCPDFHKRHDQSQILQIYTAHRGGRRWLRAFSTHRAATGT